MASVLYMHFDGELVAEDRGGTVSHYVSDTLGSTMAIVDSTGFITDQFEYWPYGEELSRTGSNPTPFTWVGTLGYFKDAAARFYVRMRSYLASAGSWMRVDPLWPGESAYAYVDGRAVGRVDLLGLFDVGTIAYVSLLPPHCIELLRKIFKLIHELDRRWKDMRLDKLGLYKGKPTGKISWKGHQIQYDFKRNQLGRLIGQYYDTCGQGPSLTRRCFESL